MRLCVWYHEPPGAFYFFAIYAYIQRETSAIGEGKNQALSPSPNLRVSVLPSQICHLCHVIFWALAALRHLPVDILVRSLDVTRLAMYAAIHESQLSRKGPRLVCGLCTHFCALI